MTKSEQKPLHGLVSAVYTPFGPDGSINLPMIRPYVEYLLRHHLDGLYICGSTGEGVNMSVQERIAVTEEFIKVTAHRVPCIIQVGSNAMPDCQELARHAQQVGADGISANAPSYFRIGDTKTLVEWLTHIAKSAPDLPFYYYHIPRFTGIEIDMTDFLTQMEQACPSFRGIKYTEMKGFAFLEGVEYGHHKYDMFWGCDEMLLSGYLFGAKGGVGSTYALAPGLYRHLVHCWESKNLDEGRRLQLLCWMLVKVLLKYAPVHPTSRLVMKMQGLDLGPCRLPYSKLDDSVYEQIKADLQTIGYFDWSLADN